VEKLVPRPIFRPLCNCLYIKLRLASLDVRIAYVHGVGVADHGRFFRVTVDVKHDFRKVLHTECQPVRYTLLFNSVSHISSSH